MSIELGYKDEGNGWDRTFLDISSKTAEPFCSVWHLLKFRLVAPLDPKKFENRATVVQEVAVRALVLLSAGIGGFLTYLEPAPILSGVIVLALVSRISRAIGFKLQKNGFTHIQGNALEKSLDANRAELKITSWNLCGLGGGMSLDHGGVVHWRSRLDPILEKIKKEDPDVLILQEVYDTALSEVLVEKLKEEYAHFFTHLGPNTWGSVGGCMVITKCAVHNFSQNDFNNNTWALNRGYSSLELKANPKDTKPCARIIGTHFIHGNLPEDQKNRKEQVEQIVSFLKHQKHFVPTILAGDLNTQRDKKEGEILSTHLQHGYIENKPTCTNGLVAQWSGLDEKNIPDETIDYISLFKTSHLNNVTLEDCHLVEAFDESLNTKTALSDHHGLSLILKGLRAE